MLISNIFSSGNKLDDFFHCSYCYELYDANNPQKLPKTLPNCLHSFCEACLDRCFNSSNDSNEIFKCPICTRKYRQFSSSNDIPIDSNILKVVETQLKSPKLNQTFYAACPSCKNIKTLEICFDCCQPICNDCLANHFGVWKDDLNRKINSNEKDLTEYLSLIGKL